MKPEESFTAPKISYIKNQWKGPLTKIYTAVDSMGNGFYYTLANMMELHDSKHIL